MSACGFSTDEQVAAPCPVAKTVRAFKSGDEVLVLDNSRAGELLRVPERIRCRTTR